MEKRLQNKNPNQNSQAKGFVLVLEFQNNACFGVYGLFDDATCFRVY